MAVSFPLKKSSFLKITALLFPVFFIYGIAGLAPSCLGAAEDSPLTTDISGYAKTLNTFYQSSGVTPDTIRNPSAGGERGEKLFDSLERIRLKLRSAYHFNLNQRILLKIDYDHQANFGSGVGGNDFRYNQEIAERQQFLDLRQTFAEQKGAFYGQRFYRAVAVYENSWFSASAGRQQIPWGVAHFFTPTDLFNPYNPTQIETDERSGVDALSLTTNPIRGIKSQWVYTPRGAALHPQRFFSRISKEIQGYEVGLINGIIHRDYAAGFDVSGNIKESAVRTELLFRAANQERNFIKWTVNADYNFPHNIYGLLEYHFNGEGRRRPQHYQRDRFARGEIQQMARNYLAAVVGKDLTSLLRFENRTIFNMDDVSFYVRPELRYEFLSNTLLTLAAQIYAGGKQDELGQPENLYFAELKRTF